MSTSKYYNCVVLMEVPYEIHKDWGASCDEIFHGPGRIHNPENGIYLIDFFELDKEIFDENKYLLFDEDGGI